MGLIRALTFAPMAPLRLTFWVTEKVAEEAERRQYSQGAVLARLRDVEAAARRGEISEREAREREDQILAEQMQRLGSRGDTVASTHESEDAHG